MEGQKSLPSRGAWIEILRMVTTSNSDKVAPLTGSVDCHTSLPPPAKSGIGRSPHGERGLKWLGPFVQQGRQLSLPSRGAWIEISPL